MGGAESATANRARLRVLLAASDAEIYRLALSALARAFEVEHKRIESPQALHDALQTGEWDVVLCDPAFASCDCREILASLWKAGSDLLVIAVGAEDDEKEAAELIKAGARAVLGPARLGRLVPIVTRELEDVRSRRLRELQALLESTPDPMLIVGTDGRVLHVNRLLEDLLGYAGTELAGQPVEVLVPESLRARHIADRERFAAAPHARPMGAGVELAARHKDGTEIPVEISLGPVRVGAERLICCGLRDLRERRRAEKLLRAVLEGTAGETGEAFLRALVKNLAQALDVRHAFVGEFVEPQRNRARVLAFWNGDGYAEPFEYPLGGTPSSVVGADSECLVREHVQQVFPEDADLVRAAAECYFGIRLHSGAGAPIGLLTIMDVKALANEALVRTVMRIFAARAGAELDRIRATASLAESEERFRRLTALAADWYWEQDEEFRFTRIDGPEDTPIAGFKSSIGRRRWEVEGFKVPPEQWAEHRKVLEARQPYRDLELPVRDASGALRWLAVSGEPVMDASGVFRGYRGTTKEITAGKRAEETLRESEQRLQELLAEQRTIFQNALTGIVYSRNRRIVRCNRTFAEFLGYQPEELIDKSTRIVYPSDEAYERFAKEAAGKLSREGRLAGEKQLMRADGGLIWVAYRVAPLDRADLGKGTVLVAIDITERKRMDEALRESEERFRATFEQAAVGIAQVAPDGRWVRVNSKLCEIVGYTREELLARTFQDITHPDDLDTDLEYVRQMLARELETYSMEKRYYRKDGSIVWINLTVSLVWKKNGEPDYFVSVIEDISRRKHAEQALREREAQVRLIADNVPAMIAHVGSDYRFRYANRSYTEFFVKGTEPVEGKTVAKVLGEAIWQQVRAATDQALSGQTVNYHRAHWCPDGSVRDLEVTMIPHRDATGPVLGYYTLILDATVRRRAEKALRESEARFRAVFAQAAVGIALRGMDGRWLDVNQKFCDILGYTRDELLGLTSVQITPAAERGEAEDYNERMRRGELSTYTREKRYVRKDGTPVWVNLSVNVVKGPDGKPDHVISVIQNITEQKRAGEEVRAREAELRLITDNVAAMIAYHDADLRYRYINRRYAEFFGVAPDELIGRTIPEHVGDEVWQKIRPPLEKALAGESVRYMRPHRHHDGGLRNLEVSVVPDRGEDGRVVGIYALVLDVTERHLAEQALRESERRYRALVELSTDWYWEQDENHRFTYRQGAVLEAMGIPAEGDYGKTRWEIGFLNMTDANWAAHRATLERREEFRDLVLARRSADGRISWGTVSGRPFFDEQGRFKGYHGTGRDVTRQVLAEQALREGAARLGLIADNVPAMIAYNDAAYRFRYANRQYIEFYAGKDAAAEGKHMAEVLGAANFASVRPGVERALAGETVRYDVTRRRHDGKLRHIDVTLVPHRENGGRVLGVYTFVLDVTESRRAEEELRESEAQLRLVADNVPAMICYFGADYRYRYANRSYADFYGDGRSIEGKMVAEFLGDEAWQAARPHVDRALAGEAVTYTRIHRRRSGKTRYVDVTLIPHRDETGRVLGVYTLILDVTQRRRSDEALRLRDRALESSVNSIMITEPTDKGQKIVYANPAFEHITGYSAAEALGRSPRFLHRDDRDQPGVEALRAAAREEREATALLRNYRKDGTLFWNELRVAPVRDETGRVTHFIGVSSDVTERIRYEEEIERHANYDTLTGLPNRNLLNDRLSQALVKSDRSKRPVGVLYVDLDHFKRINDSLGHAVGDQVIAALGARLAGTVRTGDSVARMGGDEFVVVLADLMRDDDAALVAQKLRDCVAAPLGLGAHEFVLSASVGVALYPKDGADGPTLLRNADTALYRAKEQGRDCFRFFAPEMNERVVQHLTLERDLRRALEAREFWLQYQPIVRLASGKTVGVEALIRWRRPDGSVVSPAQFIPVAEESGLIVPIGCWVLETAARQAAEWNRGRRAPLYVSVNLSARQFRDPRLLDSVRAALEGAKVDPSLLKLEITESTVMQNAEDTVRLLRGLKDLGVRLSVDDFGTGYSSLGYLKRFPLDTLKIDRSFVRDLPDDRDDLAIARAVIDLARGLELDVVAEGIETRAQAEILTANGCEFAQGYLFGRPADPETLDALMRPKRLSRRRAVRRKR